MVVPVKLAQPFLSWKLFPPFVQENLLVSLISGLFVNYWSGNWLELWMKVSGIFVSVLAANSELCKYPVCLMDWRAGTPFRTVNATSIASSPSLLFELPGFPNRDSRVFMNCVTSVGVIMNAGTACLLIFVSRDKGVEHFLAPKTLPVLSTIRTISWIVANPMGFHRG